MKAYSVRDCLLYAFSLPFLLLMLAITPDEGAAQTDIIRGRVTNSEGLPLPNVQVMATSIPGNVTRPGRTNNQGAFQIVFPGGSGDYMMSYALFGYEYRQMQVKRITDEAVLIADVRLSVLELDPVIAIIQSQERVNRSNQPGDVGGTEQTVSAAALSPEANGDLAAMAASLPGVTLLPGLNGEPDGFSVLGLGAEDNSVTMNGLPLDASSLPRDASIATSLTTSAFDVSRGGFSGGNLNITSRPGSNFRSRGMNLNATAPQFQWTDRAAQALANEYTNLSLSGSASGPLVRNQSFYNLSYQLGRQARNNPTLLNAGSLGLVTAGVAVDSVTRFLDILQGGGVPINAGVSRSDRLSDNGSVLGSIDFSPPTSATGQSFGLSFNGGWNRTSPIGGGPTQLASTSGDRINWNGGLQARHSGYLGLVLSETSFGLSMSQDEVDPYLRFPSGQVRVNSALGDGNSGVRNLSFGGISNLSTSRSTGLAFQNGLSWFDNANRHRLKLSTELQYQTATREQLTNGFGTFVFNSLEDLEAGRPASFTRTLYSPELNTGSWSAAVSLGDSYRYRPTLQLQYGLRLDAGGSTRSPAYNERVQAVFGRQNNELPTAMAISPRVGFSWSYGRAQQIGSFVGAASAPRAVIQGGIGVFANGTGGDQFTSALQNTGLPSGVQQLVCTGPAAPLPSWSDYMDDLASLPDECANGTSGTVFASSTPNVSLFSEKYRPSRSIRSNLSWRGNILDSRFSLNLAGTYSLNLNRNRSVDLNFDATERFTLDEEGRPVFVQTSSIVPATGFIASRDARVSSEFGRVTETLSDLRSRTAQMTVGLSPVLQGAPKFRWTTSYTFSHVREQLSGFSSTAGDPFAVEWARSAQGPHQINYSLSYNFFDAVQVSWNGSFRSGSRFTPMVAGDVNGDGYNNDRAFIYGAGSSAGSALAADMAELLDASSPTVRECLQGQMGSIAAPNSCRGPWSSNASLNITLDRAKFRMPNRASVSFSLSNPLAAADLMVNGSDGLRGWGQTPIPESQLLYVRGFDPATRRYEYEVNQRFGQTRPQGLTVRSPVTFTAMIRVDLGPTREQQTLLQYIDAGRTQPGSRMTESTFRSLGTGAINNPMTMILRSQDTLQLSSVQADSIAAMNRRYTFRADSLWTPAARLLSGLPVEFDSGEAYGSYLGGRRDQIRMLMTLGPAIRELLTPEQRRKLPASVTNLLDPRYLRAIRDGTHSYLSGGGGGVPSGGETIVVESAGAVVRFAQ